MSDSSRSRGTLNPYTPNPSNTVPRSGWDPRPEWDGRDFRQGFKDYLRYDTFDNSKKAFADQWINSQNWKDWNGGWYQQLGMDFGSAWSAYQVESDTNAAREQYRKLSDINSDYNKGIFNRISRINQPDGYQNSLLFRSMGLGAKSSSFLGSMSFNDLNAKAKENTYNQFEQSFENAQKNAMGYLDLASGKELSLLKIMNDQNLGLQQLKQQKEIEEAQRKSQLANSIIKTVIGGAATVLGGPLGAALFLGSTAASSLGNGGNFNYDKNPNYDYDNYTPQFSKA